MFGTILWVGDTVWTGPNNATLDDWAVYLKDRKSKPFSVVQFNMPCPWRTISCRTSAIRTAVANAGSRVHGRAGSAGDG